MFLQIQSDIHICSGSILSLVRIIFPFVLNLERFSYDLENGFGKCSLFVLLANG